MKKHEKIIKALEENVKVIERLFDDPAATTWKRGDPTCEARLSEAKYVLRMANYALGNFG